MLPRICVIGAGPSGLTAARNLLRWQIPLDCFEREDDVGGNWYFARPSSSVYASTHLISSKRLTEYTDFPMPKEYPPFPSHRQALEYLRSYARHFDLYRHIQFRTEVLRVDREGSEFGVTYRQVPDGQPIRRRYAAVIVANGHHWDPLVPELPGTFRGEIIHSRQYKDASQLAGRRVLVVGAGNSGCDIAVEAAQHAERAWISMRRGYHFLPKFLWGRPVDWCGERFRRRRFPLWAQRWMSALLVKIALGSPSRYGLPAPDHRLFETHPIVNSQLLYCVGHGRLEVRPAIERLEENRVRFVDGREEEVDLVVLATGYRISFPFLDPEWILDEHQRPKLFLNAFHPQWDNFFVAGLIQPNSGQWGLTDLQTRLMAQFLVAQVRAPAAAEWFRRRKSVGHDSLSAGIRYLDTPRHALEVEYFTYRERLRKLSGKLERRMGSAAHSI